MSEERKGYPVPSEKKVRIQRLKMNIDVAFALGDRIRECETEIMELMRKKEEALENLRNTKIAIDTLIDELGAE